MLVLIAAIRRLSRPILERAVLIAVPTLVLSLGLNVWLWQRAATAPLRIENRALGAALTTVTAIANDARRDNAALLTELDALVERGREARVVYRRAAAQTPLPAACAPGAARVQAVNQGLGPSESPLRKSP